MNFKTKAANRTQFDDFDLIQVGKLNYYGEWMTGIEGTTNKFVYGEEELTWSNVAKIARLNEPIGHMIRSRARRMESEENLKRIQSLIRDFEN